MLSKNKFRELVNQACKTESFNSLIKEKNDLSKGKEISYDSLQLQLYLSSESYNSVSDMRRIFHIRCREIHLKANFPAYFSDTKCPASDCNEDDTQRHMFSSSCFAMPNSLLNNIIKYEDIFGSDILLQIERMRIFFSKLDNRQKVFDPSKGGIPVDPRRRMTSFALGIQEAKRRRIKHKT